MNHFHMGALLLFCPHYFNFIHMIFIIYRIESLAEVKPGNLLLTRKGLDPCPEEVPTVPSLPAVAHF